MRGKRERKSPDLKMGRKSKASEWVQGDGLKLIESWKQRGLTDKEIQESIGVSHTCFSSWKRKYPELREALRKSKERADAKVENALFLSAVGHVEKVKRSRVLSSGDIVEYEEEEYVKPDIKAIMFYLCNRVPERYRTNREGMKQVEDMQQAGGVVNIVVKNDTLKELEEEKLRLVEEREQMKEEVIEEMKDAEN